VGVRLRGGLGSFSSIDDKPKLELDLNHYSGERFHGLESLSLNNSAEGCLAIQEALAYAAYDLAGVFSSRTGWAQLFVNGADYGLMLVVETQDDRWLRRNFADGSGNFYDGKYVFSGFWPTRVDFGLGRDHWFDLEEGEDVGFADIGEISAGVLRAQETGRIGEAFEARVDWEEIVTLMHVEDWTNNGDGYTSMPNNYRVYFEPGRPMVMSPWDTDDAFLVDLEEEGEWSEPAGNLGRVCLSDPDCSETWDVLGAEVDEVLADGTLYELALVLADLTEVGLAGDPRRECSAAQVESEQEALLEFLADR
jgi:spore coat protein CotH